MERDSQDHLRALGLQPGASRSEIKRAFRSLAQTYHPDVCHEPEAEDRFREIVEAYETLLRPLERVRVASGPAGPRERRGRARARSRRVPARQAIAEVEVGFVDSRRGLEHDVVFAVDETCRTCRGEGVPPGAATRTCPSCGGDGWVRAVSRNDGGRWIHVDACNECAGAGVVCSESCPTCRGSGRVPTERAVRVAIPPGVRDGMRLPVAGVAAPDPAGDARDALLVVRVLPPPDSRVVRLLAVGGIVFAVVLIVLLLKP